jgi:hypothetical protein
MATYRIELSDGNYPKGVRHKATVTTIRQKLDDLRFDQLIMQKAIGSDDPEQEASYARVAALFGVEGVDQAEKNAQAKRMYDELTGFFTALDASTGDNIRGYLGLVG